MRARDGEDQMFEKTLVAGWGDMDFNSHMRNTSYLDKGADVRMMFFAEHGFRMSDFKRLQIGPVILRDELRYFKEIGLLEPIRVTLALEGLTEDGKRFRMRNEFYRADGALAATLSSLGGWLDLAARRMIAPPDDLRRAIDALPRTDNFTRIAPM
jgi:acyl-CoA thioester hydrolase